MPTGPSWSADDFADAMARLGPRGAVWQREHWSTYWRTLRSLAPTWEREVDDANQLLLDTSPATTANLLPEWENSLGLPDACTPPGATFQQRQAAVRAKWGARGSLTIGYFTELAASLGYTITITEFSAYTAGSSCNAPVQDERWYYAWLVTVPPGFAQYFSAGHNAAGDPIVVYGDQELLCRIQHDAPAGTLVGFAGG